MNARSLLAITTLAPLALFACDRGGDSDSARSTATQADDDALQLMHSHSNVTWTTVDVNMSAGGLPHAELPERGGFVWKAGGAPTVDDHDGKLIDELHPDRRILEVTLTGLEPGTSYYLASAAEVDEGLVLSDYTVTFETVDGPRVGIGDQHEGGLIFYFLKEDDPGYVEGEVHGLIAAPADVEAAQWGGRCGGSVATSTDLGAGDDNTENIVAYHEALDDYAGNPTQCHRDNDGSVAAANAADASFGDFDDWHLPSRDELRLIYRNLHAHGLGDFATTQYWSSSLGIRGGLGYNIQFEDGSAWTTSRDVTYRVRPVRAF